MAHRLNEIEQEARISIANLVSVAIAKLSDDAFRFGQDTYYNDHTLLNIIRLNVENEGLSDADFRQFVLNSLSTAK